MPEMSNDEATATVAELRDDVAPAFAGGEVLGDTMFAAGALAWASYAILGRSATRRFHAAAITCLSSALGAATFAALTALVEPAGFAAVGSASVRALAGVVYLGTFGTVLSFVFFYLGVERIGSARASAYAVLIPLFGVAATVTVLREPIEPIALAGAALVIAGLRMMQAGDAVAASPADGLAPPAEGRSAS
jgi:drug/metabolite transporter (DMT)-like permease